VIVYGICIGSEEKYSTFCAPYLAAFVESSNVIESRGNDSIFIAYNAVLDQVAARPGVEALVLLHEDLELVPSDFEEQIRRHFQDPDVAIIGAIGGRGVQGVRWSQAHERFGRMPDSFNGANDFGGGTHEVDIVDGCLLALSPWAVANLRFDSRRFKGFHAYDADICMQARAAGKKVIVADLPAFHHTKGGFGDIRRHQISDEVFRRKWGIPQDPWRRRLYRRMPWSHPIVERIRSAGK
jgi:hypothetical protein